MSATGGARHAVGDRDGLASALDAAPRSPRNMLRTQPSCSSTRLCSEARRHGTPPAPAQGLAGLPIRRPRGARARGEPRQRAGPGGIWPPARRPAPVPADLAGDARSCISAIARRWAASASPGGVSRSAVPGEIGGQLERSRRRAARSAAASSSAATAASGSSVERARCRARTSGSAAACGEPRVQRPALAAGASARRPRTRSAGARSGPEVLVDHQQLALARPVEQGVDVRDRQQLRAARGRRCGPSAETVSSSRPSAHGTSSSRESSAAWSESGRRARGLRPSRPGRSRARARWRTAGCRRRSRGSGAASAARSPRTSRRARAGAPPSPSGPRSSAATAPGRQRRRRAQRVARVAARAWRARRRARRPAAAARSAAPAPSPRRATAGRRRRARPARSARATAGRTAPPGRARARCPPAASASASSPVCSNRSTSPERPSDSSSSAGRADQHAAPGARAVGHARAATARSCRCPARRG